MIPSIGRIVHYRLSVHDVEAIKHLREHSARQCDDTGYPDPRWASRFGTPVTTGQVCAAIIVAVDSDPESPTWETNCNLRVLLNGNDDLWVTDVEQGTDAGEWQEPARVGPPLVSIADAVSTAGALGYAAAIARASGYGNTIIDDPAHTHGLNDSAHAHG